METIIVLDPSVQGLFYEVIHGFVVVTYKETTMPENFWMEFYPDHTEEGYSQMIKCLSSSRRTFIIVKGDDDVVEIAEDIVTMWRKKRKRELRKKRDVAENNFDKAFEKMAEAVKAHKVPQVELWDNAGIALNAAQTELANADRDLKNLVRASDSEESAKRGIALLKRFFSLQIIGCKT